MIKKKKQFYLILCVMYTISRLILIRNTINAVTFENYVQKKK